ARADHLALKQPADGLDVGLGQHERPAALARPGQGAALVELPQLVAGLAEQRRRPRKGDVSAHRRTPHPWPRQSSILCCVVIAPSSAPSSDFLVNGKPSMRGADGVFRVLPEGKETAKKRSRASPVVSSGESWRTREASAW